MTYINCGALLRNPVRPSSSLSHHTGQSLLRSTSHSIQKPIQQPSHTRLYSSRMAPTVNSDIISSIHDKEKTITNKDNAEKGGPTATAQSHAGEQLSGEVISDITKAEKEITESGERIKGGPTSVAQSILTKENQKSN